MSSNNTIIDDSDGFSIQKMFENPDGSGVFSMTVGDNEFSEGIEQKLSSKQDVGSNNGAVITPHDESGDRIKYEKVGAVNRAIEFMTFLSPSALEQLCKTNHELSSAINRVVDEVFREDFPILQPTVEDASEEERESLEARFRSVNEAKQSLHAVLKQAMSDHARLGTGTIKIRRRYQAYEGNVIKAGVKEIVRADPKRLKPVTDENNNIGGLYACPIHRERVSRDENATCEECGADLWEVTYAQVENIGSNAIERVFFDDEVISFSFHNTMLQGRDGLPPSVGVWKQSYLLNQFRNYVGQYYADDTGDKYPNTLLFISVSDAEAFEKQAKEAKDSRQESHWEQGIIYGENADYTIEKVEMMPSQMLGDRSALTEEYKDDIRNAYGVPAVVQSEEDSSSLASGSKGLEVFSRRIQAHRTDLERDVLPEIEEVFGMEDWELSFKEETSEEQKMTMLEQAEAAQRFASAGIAVRVEDGIVKPVDTDDPIDNESEETEDLNEQDRTDVSL